mgnify:CR=1 FL=1
MMRRENVDLVPLNEEIYRRIAEELDFCRRLLLDIIENPNDYCLGENHQDINNMSTEFLTDADTMIVNLIGRSESDNSESIRRNPAVNANKAVEERVVGASGESKTNIWRRLREKAEFFIFGGGRALLHKCVDRKLRRVESRW